MGGFWAEYPGVLTGKTVGAVAAVKLPTAPEALTVTV